MKRIILTSIFSIILSTGCGICSADNNAELDILKKQILLLQEQIAKLEKRIPDTATHINNNLQKTVLAKNNKISSSVDNTINSKPQEILSTVSDSDSDEKFWQLAETSTKVSIGGFFKLTGIYDLSGSTANGNDGAGTGRNFLTARSIGLDGKDSHSRDFYIHARDSRLAIITESMLDNEKLTACFEVDFLGDPCANPAVSNGYNIRMRKAYANFKGFTIGQDWSTFTNIDTIGETVDRNGPVGHCQIRQALIRYTTTWNNCIFNFAIENPESEFITKSGKLSSTYSSSQSTPYIDENKEGDAIKGENKLPDFVIAAKYPFQNGYIRAAGLLKRNSIYDKHRDCCVSTIGDAISLSFLYNISDINRFVGQLTFGTGSGRYFTDALNTSTYYDGIKLHNQNELHVSFGYRHCWAKKNNVRSTVAFGYAQFDNSSAFKENTKKVGNTDPIISEDNASKVNKHVLSLHANLMANLNKLTTIGVEYIIAKRKAEIGKSGTLHRITFGLQLDF